MKLINSARFTAVLDANVIYPVVVRDYLLWLATYELYTPKWSHKILEEFRQVFARKNLNISEEQVIRQTKIMNDSFPDALVVGYEFIMPSIQLPDENDIHVVAAAIRCNANVIVTNNLDHFRPDNIQRYGISAISPDNFIADLIDLSPKLCCEALSEMLLNKTKPPYEELEYLTIFKNNGLAQTSSELAKHLNI